MLREVAVLTGLSAQVTAALADTYGGPWTYAPGAVFADLAAAVADGADCIDSVGRRPIRPVRHRADRDGDRYVLQLCPRARRQGPPRGVGARLAGGCVASPGGLRGRGAAPLRRDR